MQYLLALAVGVAVALPVWFVGKRLGWWDKSVEKTAEEMRRVKERGVKY
jgi:hypothetical protein